MTYETREYVSRVLWLWVLYMEGKGKRPFDVVTQAALTTLRRDP